jgi:DNA-binding PadR family transcriptional regulator
MHHFNHQGRPRHRGRGGPDWQGIGPWERRVFEGRRGPGMRRGEVRPLILAALARKPMHGYEVIQELERQSGGRWRPSAGSVYPTLQQLADEGLVTSQDVDSRRIYELTDAGRESAQDAPPGPDVLFARFGGGGGRRGELGSLAGQLMGAVMQVDRMGSPKAREEARVVLTDARKRLYRVLAEDEDVAEHDAPASAPRAESQPGADEA